MAHVPQALDIEQQQIAEAFDEDPNFRWHHRILLVKIGDDGRWVYATPTLDVQVRNLSSARIVPLVRGCPIPARLRGNFYGFDPLSEDDLASLMQQAHALAAILGGVSPSAAAAAALWHVADPADENFATVVEVAVTSNPGRFVTRGHCGLARLDDQRWVAVERLLPGDLAAWKEEKQTGAGRDPRVLAINRDGQDARFLDFKEGLATLTELPVKKGRDGATEAEAKDWPFRGPSAALELLRGIRSTGESLESYHEAWVRSTGVHAEAGVAKHHQSLISVLHHALCFDQIEIYHSASMEMLARRVLYIERAVKKSPKNPDFRGLEMMIHSRLDSGTTLACGDFARFIADEQKTEAFTLKQQRLYAEESGRKKGGKDHE